MPKTLEELRAELEKREIPKITKEEIEEYNQKPEVKERGAKIVTISSDRTKNIALILLLVIAISFATFAYLAYNDKLKLLSIDIPKCPEPAMPVVIPDCVCPTVNVACSNITLSCPSLNNSILRLGNLT